MGVEPTIRLAKSRIAGFEGRDSHRTIFASNGIIRGATRLAKRPGIEQRGGAGSAFRGRDFLARKLEQLRMHTDFEERTICRTADFSAGL